MSYFEEKKDEQTITGFLKICLRFFDYNLKTKENKKKCTIKLTSTLTYQSFSNTSMKIEILSIEFEYFLLGTLNVA